MGEFGPGLWSLKSLVEFHFLDPERLRLDMEPLSGRWLGVMGVACAELEEADGGGIICCCCWLLLWMAAVRRGAVDDLLRAKSLSYNAKDMYGSVVWWCFW